MASTDLAKSADLRRLPVGLRAGGKGGGAEAQVKGRCGRRKLSLVESHCVAGCKLPSVSAAHHADLLPPRPKPGSSSKRWARPRRSEPLQPPSPKRAPARASPQRCSHRKWRGVVAHEGSVHHPGSPPWALIKRACGGGGGVPGDVLPCLTTARLGRDAACADKSPCSAPSIGVRVTP
eukprot:scaffold117179_cov28-Tisochrysis_lutea.AAC.5